MSSAIMTVGRHRGWPSSQTFGGPPTTGPTANCVGSKPCLRRWTQEDGSDLGGSCHWTPTGWTCQWVVIPGGGSLHRAPSHQIRGSFYWTPMCRHTCGWSAFGGSFHRHLSHLTCPCLFVFSIPQVSRDRQHPPPAVVGPFLAGSGGGVYLCQALGTSVEKCSLYMTEDWPGGRRFGWECSPTTLVA